MKEDKPTLDSLFELRRRAEAALPEQLADVQAPSVEETHSLIHELEVHQIELEMQNEELRRAQQELAAVYDKYADLYDFAPVGYFTVGENGLILEANLTGADLLGVERGSLLGKPLSRFIARADQDVYYKHRRQVLATKDRRTCEIEMVKRDGTEFYAQIESACLADSDGPVTKHRTIISDITQRKVKEAQLLQAQKMEVVGQLTGGIAHDFNNLLTVIMGNLRLLEEDLGRDADEKRRELVDDALSAARDGAELIRRLLAFSPRQPLQPRRVDINDLLDDVQRFLRRALEVGVELRIHRREDVMAVFADPGKLENALLNLAINARDAMPKGGTLSIETTRKGIDLDEAVDYPGLAPGSYVMVCVSDTGVGMSPEEAARAVEPFYTTKRDGKGSGFGLSMVYGFTRQSGGGLRITSEPGMGTTVSMLFPESIPAVEAGGEQESLGDLPRGSETILVVEDEARVRKLARRSLTSLGYHVLEAKNAVEAIKILSSEPAVDLLFSDIVIPGAMNGRELARWALANRAGLKVLLTTGFSEAMESEPSVDHGGFLLLKKPYTKEHLAQAIQAALDAQTH